MIIDNICMYLEARLPLSTSIKCTANDLGASNINNNPASDDDPYSPGLEGGT